MIRGSTGSETDRNLEVNVPAKGWSVWGRLRDACNYLRAQARTAILSLPFGSW